MVKKFKEYRFVKFLAVLLISLVIFLFWFHYNSLNTSIYTAKIHSHAKQVSSLVDDFTLYMFDIEIAQSNYLISKNEKFYDRFISDKERTVTHLANLGELSRFSFAERNKFDSLNKLCQEKFSAWDNEIILYRTGQNDKLNASKETSKLKMDEVKSILHSFGELESGFVRNAFATENREEKFSFNILLIGSSIIGIIVLSLFVILFIEIKKRQKTETALFVSNDWHSKTLESMGDGVISTDNNGNIIFLNKVAEDITGWKTDDAKNKSINDVFHILNGKTKQPVENPVIKALRENKIVFLEEYTLLIKKDGSTVSIDDSAAPVIDDYGDVIGGVLIFRDITELEANKKKLIESEKFLKDIIDSTTSLIIIKDINSKFLLVNPQYEKVFNCKAKDIIGKSSSVFHPSELVSKFEAEDAEVMSRGEKIQFEGSVKHADGSTHFYHTVKFPLFDSVGSVYGLCSVATDITESKNNIEIKEKYLSQQKILKSEIKYTELTDNMPSMFLSLNHQMEIIHWNKACEEFNCLQAEDVLGKRFIEVLPHIKDGELFLKCKEAIKTAAPQNFIHKITYTGTEFIYFINIYPTLQGISILMSDVTEQKRSEQETLELVERLQNRNKELRQFTYIVSHNLRAPIAKIRGLASLFSSEPTEAELNLTLMENLNEEALNLDNVVIDLNTIISSRDSKSASKENVYFEIEIDLIKQVLVDDIKRCGCEIKMNFHDAPKIYSVKSYIYSILFNLISNSIKYCSPVRLCNIEIKTEIIDKFICLTVKDNGIGINMEKNKEKIFGLYKRFHSDSSIGGKGIGLYLVKTQAESLDGKIEIESKVNTGTTFKIYLPNEKQL